MLPARPIRLWKHRAFPLCKRNPLCHEAEQKLKREAMLKRFISFLILAAAILFAPPASAEKRVALVIGNGGYDGQPALKNPPNDARDIAEALKNLGFQVILGLDLDKHGFDDKVHEFARSVTGAEVALFYYSGHGMQMNGVNYLVPINAPIRKEDLDFQTVTLDLVQKQLASAKVKLVFLDACRNNPFARSLALSAGARALGENSGLAVTTAPDLGSFIAFATQPGQVASDGEGSNSPFTGSLKAHISTAGLSISDLMIVVRNEVVQQTNAAQIPWDHSALASRFYFKQGQAAEPSDAKRNTSDAAEVWGWVRDTSNPAALEQFIAKYGDTPFAEQAKQRLKSVKQAQPKGAQPEVSYVGDAPLRPSKPSFDCKGKITDAETKVCNTPELSLLDTEMDRLYTLSLKNLDGEDRKSLVEKQRKWVKDRLDCVADIGCLAKLYQGRIEKLKTFAKGVATPRPQVRPSFDCANPRSPAELAICSDAKLAQQDLDLDRLYVEKLKKADAEQRRALAVEQRQWVRDRDICGGYAPCLKVQYQARIEQLQKPL
jgi:uncharacterized protein